MKLSKRRAILLSVLIIIVFLALTLLFWDFVRQNIALPLYFLIWLLGLLINSLPQEVYLALLVIVCGVVGLVGLGSFKRPVIMVEQSRIGRDRFSRYRLWISHTRNFEISAFAQDTFAFEARKLIMDILAYQERLTTEELESKIKADRLPLPAVVRTLIEDRKLTTRPTPVGSAQDFLRLMRARFIKEKRSSNPRVDPQVDEILKFLEKRLEM